MLQDALYIPGEGTFPLLKPLVGFKAEILSRLERFPYERNVFLMLRFRTANADLSDHIIETLARHGFQGVRADQPEWNITGNVYNPVAVLSCCKYGLALFDEPEEGQAFSPNVAYELGMMHLQRKSCLILRHASLPQVPFDLIKDLHWPYQSDSGVRELIDRWVGEISGETRPARPPAFVQIDEEALARGGLGLARLSALGLRDVAPRPGGLDIEGLVDSARERVDVAFLPSSTLRSVLGGLRRFARETRGEANLLVLDPGSDLARVLRPGSAADLAETIEALGTLVGDRARATVSLYVSPLAPCPSLLRFDHRMIISACGGLESQELPSLLLEQREDPGSLFGAYLDAYTQILRQHARLRWTNRL
ncbi:MAG TPA: hypothetical protein VE685_26460 [Thermoanaerobaculia bacterium]|nr:hypothetical protein [Thermoanaerobaculia bacterium]